jgi:ferric-dicitrate binding protein FerR (iron transport regulator)
MADQVKRLAELFLKHFENAISPGEIAELQIWFDASPGNRRIFDVAMKEENIVEALTLWREAEQTKEADKARIDWDLSATQTQETRISKINSSKWRRMTAAAAIILLVSGGVYYGLHRTTKQETEKTPLSTAQHAPDILPGGNKATLKLANGQTIILDSAANGTLTQQGDSRVLKLNNGQIAYNASNKKSITALYNTLTTPRGGQYYVELADGTKVWLNAASSLSYPTSFTGKDRVVELKGEAYFEVARNNAMPFKVRLNNTTVEVLGTHFNVNAYEDDALIKTTLLEGSVRISSGGSTSLLSPGQQAQVNKAGSIKLIPDADTELAIAWKKGYFQFKRDNLQQVLGQLTKWYDVTVKYDGVIPDMQFGGRISRNSNLSEVLKILELSNVHFKIEGKTVVVMP